MPPLNRLPHSARNAEEPPPLSLRRLRIDTRKERPPSPVSGVGRAAGTEGETAAGRGHAGRASVTPAGLPDSGRKQARSPHPQHHDRRKPEQQHEEDPVAAAGIGR
jgi:hypothetical protein